MESDNVARERTCVARNRTRNNSVTRVAGWRVYYPRQPPSLETKTRNSPATVCGTVLCERQLPGARIHPGSGNLGLGVLASRLAVRACGFRRRNLATLGQVANPNPGSGNSGPGEGASRLATRDCGFRCGIWQLWAGTLWWGLDLAEASNFALLH